MYIDELKQWLETEEGINFNKRYWERENYKDAQQDRATEIIKNLSSDEFFLLLQKLIKRERRYSHYWYEQGVITNSKVFEMFFEACSTLGEDYHSEGTFLSSSKKYRGYTFKIYQGQGSCLSISDESNEIYSS